VYQQKIETFVQDNNFSSNENDPTDVYQKQKQQQYTIYPDMRYVVALARWGHIGSYIVKDVHKNNPQNINKWESKTEQACYCMVLLLQQYGVHWLTVVI